MYSDGSYELISNALNYHGMQLSDVPHIEYI